MAPFTLLSVGHGHPISPPGWAWVQDIASVPCVCVHFMAVPAFLRPNMKWKLCTHIWQMYRNCFAHPPHFHPTLVVAAGFGFSRQLIFIFSSRTHIPEPPYRTHPLPPLCGHFVVNKFNNLFRLQWQADAIKSEIYEVLWRYSKGRKMETEDAQMNFMILQFATDKTYKNVVECFWKPK